MRVVALLSLCAAAAQAETVSFGIKGGVPLSEVFQGKGVIGGLPFVTQQQRFTLGPVAELRLPFGLGAEFNALYKRFDQSAASRSGQPVSGTGSSWEFPLVAKYRIPGIIARPYLEVGPTWNRLSGVLAFFRAAPASPQTFDTTRRGFVAGGGLEIRIPRARISPGLRISRWSSTDQVPGNTLVDFLVGLTF